MPRRRKTLVLAAVFLLLMQILAASLVLTAYAFSRQEFAIDLNIDRSSAKGFESVGGTFDTPDFVLKQDSIGTFNIILHSHENASVISTLNLGGSAHSNYSDTVTAASDIPKGIVYNIEPDRITLAPNSTVIAKVKITATSETVPRRYVLGVNLDLDKGGLTEGRAYSIAFTIVTGNYSSTSTTTCINKTVTTTVTSTQTITVTSIINSTTKTITAGETPNLSTTTSTQTTTTASTTLTSTVTTTSTEKIADSSTYAWAVSATVAAVILAVVLLQQRRAK